MIFSKPFYHVFKVKDHHLNKERILSEVSQSKVSYQNTEIADRYSYISNTDWDTNIDFNWFTKAFSSSDQLRYKLFVAKKFKRDSAQVNSSWFNQYYANSGCEHVFHDHVSTGPYGSEKTSTGCDLTNIYYVELSDRSLRTVLKHPTTGKEIISNVREGDIITFRSDILHKSPPNYTNTRKTVIAFNLEFLE